MAAGLTVLVPADLEGPAAVGMSIAPRNWATGTPESCTTVVIIYGSK